MRNLNTNFLIFSFSQDIIFERNLTKYLENIINIQNNDLSNSYSIEGFNKLLDNNINNISNEIKTFKHNIKLKDYI